VGNVSYTLAAAPAFPAGTVLGVYDRRRLGLLTIDPPKVNPVTTAAVDSTLAGHATFTNLQPERWYAAGAEVSGEWRWMTFRTDEPTEPNEQARAEAVERELSELLLGVTGSTAKPSGYVEGWGYAVGSALGVGNGTGLFWIKTPTLTVPVLGSVIGLGGGQSFTIALTNDGRVWHMGGSTFGESADGTTKEKPSPHAISLPEPGVELGANTTSLVKLAGGRVMAWGPNSGQLGIGSDNAMWEPVYIESAEGSILENVAQIAVGHKAAFLLMGDNSLRWAGIADLQGERQFYEPEATVGATGWEPNSPITKVTGSKGFCMCLLADGTIRLKGRNNYGQMGNGVFEPSTPPTKRWFNPGLTGVADIAQSEYSAYALMRDGTVRCWGRNNKGQIGNGFRDAHANPPTVTKAGTGKTTVSASIASTTLTASAADIASLPNKTIVRAEGVTVGTEVVSQINATSVKVSVSQTVSTRTMEAFPPLKLKWALKEGQTRYEARWRATGLYGTINGSISGTTLTVTSGTVHVGTNLSGGGVKTGTKVLEWLAPGSWRVNSSQTVAASSIETEPQDWLHAANSPELGGAVTEYELLGWEDASIEAQIIGEAAVTAPYNPGVTEVVELRAGGGEEAGGLVGGPYVIVRKASGAIEGWGANTSAQLGNGDRRTRLTAVPALNGITNAIRIGLLESHGAVCRSGEQPTATAALTAEAVPASPDIIVKWTPPAGERVKTWEVKWRRVEKNPSTAKQEAFKSTNESLSLAGNVTEYRIKGLPLPALWANATNLLEVQVSAKFAQAVPTITAVENLGGRKWRATWSASTKSGEGYEWNGTEWGSKTTFTEPGWVPQSRISTRETFAENKEEEIPGGTGEYTFSEIPEGAALEVRVEGAWESKFGTRQVFEVMPNEMPAEVPYLKVGPKIKLGSLYRKPRANVAVIKVEEAGIGKGPNPSEWVVTFVDTKAPNGRKEPSWIVRWRNNPQTGWEEAASSAVIPNTGGTMKYAITGQTAKPEVQVYGNESNVGDLLEAIPGEWANATTLTTRARYQWYRQEFSEAAAVPIAGATARTYRVQPVDFEYALKVLEVPKNEVGEANIISNPSKAGPQAGAPTQAVIRG